LSEEFMSTERGRIAQETTMV